MNNFSHRINESSPLSRMSGMQQNNSNQTTNLASNQNQSQFVTHIPQAQANSQGQQVRYVQAVSSGQTHSIQGQGQTVQYAIAPTPGMIHRQPGRIQIVKQA
jgi:hypothetical protein